MSLILDALNRSRQDANPVPGLATHHPVEAVSAEGRQLLLWAVLAVALAVIAWLVMERFSAPPPAAADIGAPVAELSKNIGSAVTSVTSELQARATAAAPAVAEPALATAVTTAPLQTPEPAATALTLPVELPETLVATAPAPSSAPRPAQVAAAPAAGALTLTTQESDAVAQLYQNRELQKDPVMPEPTVRTKSAEQSRTDMLLEQARAQGAMADPSTVARSDQSDDLDKILNQAREELENASLDDHPVSFLSSLSQQVKDDIPTLYYQRHDYSSDTSVSSVVLNGATVKAGGSPLPGMQVEEILPDSVVLNYRGTQFRLRALNSWVNL